MENFKSARRYLMIPSQGKYNDGLFVTELCEIYLDYMEDVNSTDGEDNVAENLLKALTHYCEEVQRKFPIGWVILYCVYKKHNYNPGMSYARWKYENLVDAFFIEIKYIPKSRWEIFNNFTPKLITKKGIFFWKGCQFLLQFGLYYFAWLLFEDIANELEEIERYIIDTSFKLAVKLVGSNFITQNFLLGERMADELKAFVCLVNGNIEYYRDPYKAMGHYGFILDISNASKDSRFQLGVLRYAYRMLKEKELEEALEAFEFAGRSENDLIIANVGKAKALYFLGRLKEAKLFFAETTRFSMYLPNVWAYLAVINLRLGQNYEALECWKYANLNTDVIIHDEILNELAELNIKDISLYVDSPEKRIK
uniref:Tetratricopeptide repeat protein n=1 Tax=Glossina brevipalpis TaxID=37001 RepID=A0A1A9W422_9MUSC